MNKITLLIYCPLFFLILFTNSCSSTKKIKYFQDIPDSGQLKTIAKVEYAEPKILVDDILTINIQTIDPQSSGTVTTGNVTSSNVTALGAAALFSNVGASPSSGYLVDKEGTVNISIVGKVKLAGLTTFEATQVVQTAVNIYYKHATVNVRFANFKINVTGEVLRPGTYTMPNEKVTILDALALAGDLTIFGKRENVLLIRDNPDGTRTPYRINLKNSNIMSAPYFYLRQNDFIYVEARKAKSDATDASQTRYITIAGTILSLIIVFATRR
ncbi:MAG: polysaccharide biosynthesis/export family protein [Mucilaginibacter sp.]